MKRCTKCKTEKPLNMFGQRAGTTYYQSWCKACACEHAKSRYAKTSTWHDSLVRKLREYIMLDPKDNAQYLITLIKCALIDSGYSDSEACDIIDE